MKKAHPFTYPLLKDKLKATMDVQKKPYIFPFYYTAH